MYKQIIRPLFFKVDPETIHHTSFNLLRWTQKIPFVKSVFKSKFEVNDPKLEREFWGIKFKNPIGLAAGFDKDAVLIDELSHLGFGFIEIGTLTPKGQEGNPKKRLFRLPQDHALINRMGFNNKGVDTAVLNLKRRKSNVIVGGNIGKNKVTPNEKAYEDYLYCLDALHEVVDYFVVNVSSPNTPGLRELQDKEPLKALLIQLQEKNRTYDQPKPILLKIAPDVTPGQADDIADIIKEIKLDGLILSNTTIDRSNLKTSEKEIESIGAGGLSGKPVRQKSTDLLIKMRALLGEELPIIAVGGIFTGEDALEKLKAGASLVQVYTGFVYEGPSMISKINKFLLRNM